MASIEPQVWRPGFEQRCRGQGVWFTQSVDGAARKPCGPGNAEGGSFSPRPANPHVIEAENDRAYAVWPETEENKYLEGCQCGISGR